MESRPRSIVKAVIWQVMGLVVMGIIGLIYTGSLRAGGAIAGLNAAIGLVTYLIYERVWARIGWGRTGV